MADLGVLSRERERIVVNINKAEARLASLCTRLAEVERQMHEEGESFQLAREVKRANHAEAVARRRDGSQP